MSTTTFDTQLRSFAEDVGAEGPVTVVGGKTRWSTGGELTPGTREVQATVLQVGGGGHEGMDHGAMDHPPTDHGSMDHSQMDHSQMDHAQMDHGAMDHGESESPESESAAQDEAKEVPGA